MGGVSNTEYVTITKDGRFIGGQPTDEYRGVPIPAPSKKDISWAFSKTLQDQGIKEIHCLTSVTGGVEFKPGKPSGKHGPNIWVRVKLNNEKIGNWVLISSVSSPDEAAFWCLKLCFDGVWSCDCVLMKALAPEGTAMEINTINLLGDLITECQFKQI